MRKSHRQKHKLVNLTNQIIIKKKSLMILERKYDYL